MTDDSRYAAPARADVTPRRSLAKPRRWYRPNLAVGPQGVDATVPALGDATTTTLVPVDRGWAVEWAGEPHGDQVEGSLDNLARLVCR